MPSCRLSLPGWPSLGRQSPGREGGGVAAPPRCGCGGRGEADSCADNRGFSSQLMAGSVCCSSVCLVPPTAQGRVSQLLLGRNSCGRGGIHPGPGRGGGTPCNPMGDPLQSRALAPSTPGHPLRALGKWEGDLSAPAPNSGALWLSCPHTGPSESRFWVQVLSFCVEWASRTQQDWGQPTFRLNFHPLPPRLPQDTLHMYSTVTGG